ncbi:MAG: hypothetical protein OEW49_06555 [Nitrosopumilus sp.]|nr:hypothetical protein [Nitrosopumilus sp.]
MTRCNISLRCFADAGRPLAYNDSFLSNDSTVLVFGSQTTQDKYQNLVVGTCGIWVNGKLQQFCLYDDSVQQIDKTKFAAHLPNNCTISVMSRDEFACKVFFPTVYSGRAKCVGFDLPFEISRLAIHWGKARKMENGFSFKLTENPVFPNIRIKNLNGNAAIIQFAAPIRNKSQKKRKAYRGFFLDLKTFHYSMTNKSCEDVFQAGNIESHTNSNRPESSIEKTIVTYRFYQKLVRQFTDVFLLPAECANKIYSPASIAKNTWRNWE